MANGPHTEGRASGPPASGPSGDSPEVFKPDPWRVVLADRALPLPILRPITIGSDPRNGIQISHGSVRPVHARLVKRGDVIHVGLVRGTDGLEVDGKAVTEALLKGGEQIKVGVIPLRIERGEIAPAVVMKAGAPLSHEQEFYRAMRRELSRAPWFALSLALHAAALLIARNLMESAEVDPLGRSIQASIGEPRSPLPFDSLADLVEEPPEPPLVIEDLPDLETLDDDVTELDLDYFEEGPVASVEFEDRSRLGLGRGGGRPKAGGLGRKGVDLRSVKGPLRGKLQQYREQGLDLVFLIDTTASMEPFLREAKGTVDRIITDLSMLNPNLRLGVVAYRDEGDEYVTRASKISNDRYAILNFLESQSAKGGGDVPEAVLAALEYALDELEWRKGAHRVVVIIADAPPHPDDTAKLRMRIKTAVKSSRNPTIVSTIFTGSGSLAASRQVEAERALREVAELGDGEFSHLENMGEVKAQLIAISLGTQHSKAVSDILNQRMSSSRQRAVTTKVKERDVNWLFKKLHFEPVEPAVVEGLVEIGSPAVSMRCLDVVLDPSCMRYTREAALYTLKRITRHQGSIDFGRSLAGQEEQIRGLRKAVERTHRPERRRANR